MVTAVTLEETLAAIEEFKKEVLTPLEPPTDLSATQQLEMYRKMAVIREFDTNVKELWKQNFIYGLAHSYVGAEAVAVAQLRLVTIVSRPLCLTSALKRANGPSAR